ncbi:MAG: general secretion pathway protein GspD [Rubrivivax sp.]|nr:MAG: general secretion pathway protein GspD [Rubrivivax sp.]
MKLLLNLVGAVIVAGLLTACANPALREANDMVHAGQHEAALARLQQALNEKKDDGELRAALIKQRDTTVAYLVYQADSARAAGNLDAIEAVLKRLELAAPGHPRAIWLRSEVDRLRRHQRFMADAQQAFDAKAYERAEVSLRTVLAEDVGNGPARNLLSRIEELRATQTRRTSTLELANATKPITLEFREAALRTVFEALARAANVNFVFDKDVRGDAKVTLFLRNTTVDEAMRVITNTQQLGVKLLNDNTVLVFPNTVQKQRELLDTITRSFYLVNADPKQAQTLVRTVAKSKDIYVDDRLNMLVVRDTPEVMRLVERLIQNIDMPDPEVMLELEVMDVSSTLLNTIGISWSDTATFGQPSPATIATSFTGMRWSTTNPLAVATLRGSKTTSNLLANPKIRARNHEKAKILLGEKLPVFTSNLVPGLSGAASTSINYIDVGLKLDIEPTVQLDNDVTIKMALEVSSVTGKVDGPAGSGSSAYQIGTRQASTTLRLKDGETQILAGLINDNESRNSAGIPGLHDLPVAGRLFGTTTDQRNKTEIVMLITPRIVRNLTQPAMGGAALPSGTEAQPGARALLLRDESSTSGLGGGRGAGGRAAALRSRPNAPAADAAQSITGPEEVMPGAAFQVTIRNATDVPFSGGLVIEPGVLEVEGPAGKGGQVSLNVPPQGVQVVTLRVKPGATASETLVALDSGGEPLRLQIRSPSSPEAPQAPVEEPPATPAQPDVPLDR